MKIKDILLEEEHDLTVDTYQYYNGDDYYCTHAPITSLNGAPRVIRGNFSCSFTNITSLKGGPEKVNNNFWCNKTKITTLEGGPIEVGNEYLCHDNNLISLKGLPKSCRRIYLPQTYEGPILRLCLVKNLKEVYGIKSELARKIINKHLNQGNAGLIRAQRELIENDLEIYAKL